MLLIWDDRYNSALVFGMIGMIIIMWDIIKMYSHIALHFCKHELENNFILKCLPGEWICMCLRVYMDVESK